jgi:glutathione S-transferase
MNKLTLVSHPLCPYAQRASIAASRLGLPVKRVNIDLDAKPAWFLAISPTGKVPILRIELAQGERHVLFESAPIAEYLNDLGGGALLETDDIVRAQQRAWIEFASGTLSEIAGLYSATTKRSFLAKAVAIRARLAQVDRVVQGPWFGGSRFSLVDAAFAPLFRYVDFFEAQLGLQLDEGLKNLKAWRSRLSVDATVRAAVSENYWSRLHAFLLSRSSFVSAQLRARSGAV